MITVAAFRQRFRLAWQITWPMAAIDLAFVFLMHGLFDVEGEAWDSVWAVASFFFVWPWVIRRALGRAGIVTQRAAGDDAGPLRYQESLKVMWLLEWRSTVLLLAAALAISAALRVAGWKHDFAAQSGLVNALGLSLMDALSNLLFIPLLIPGLLRKRFRGFRLAEGVPKLAARRERLNNQTG